MPVKSGLSFIFAIKFVLLKGSHFPAGALCSVIRYNNMASHIWIWDSSAHKRWHHCNMEMERQGIIPRGSNYNTASWPPSDASDTNSFFWLWNTSIIARCMFVPTIIFPFTAFRLELLACQYGMWLHMWL